MIGAGAAKRNSKISNKHACVSVLSPPGINRLIHAIVGNNRPMHQCNMMCCCLCRERNRRAASRDNRTSESATRAGNNVSSRFASNGQPCGGPQSFGRCHTLTDHLPADDSWGDVRVRINAGTRAEPVHRFVSLENIEICWIYHCAQGGQVDVLYLELRRASTIARGIRKVVQYSTMPGEPGNCVP